MRSGAITPALAFVAALAVPSAPAQISPGKLSRPHAKLEGNSHCLDCHDPKQGVAPAKCLSCHEPLQRRIAAGKGLHARQEYRDCKTCHVEHQGLEFELVWWGKQGREAFDHALTGQPLAGKHRELACAKCHQQRSYLGAPVDCAACHKDVHQGQFAGRACSSCHTQQTWRPAPGFDHAKSRWPLTGRHAQVACEKCHPRPESLAGGATALVRVFHAVSGQECARCHQDPHRARLGSACASCHATSGWREVRSAGFDHSKTAYPLLGRHATVACDACHRPGAPLRPPHARCSDCHRDAHAGELARRADQGRCESCHDVNGFRPARFGPQEHDATRYPLRGAHLAVACDACHRRPGAAATAAGRSASLARGAFTLRFEARRCGECHADPHRGGMDRFAGAGGCESCHSVESWRRVSFDHARTRFVLDGAHARVACAGCHRPAERAGVPVRFSGLTSDCAGCHRDPHAGQFAAAGRPAACERCHGVASFSAGRFDHARDSSYRLDGAHARLACAACHKQETRNGQRFVRYKPLPTRCAGCHTATPATGGRP